MTTLGNRKVYIQIGVLNLLVLAGGFGANVLTTSRAWLALACTAIGMITFFGLLGIGQDTNASDHNMRTAATGAIIVVYLTLVSIYAFFRPPGEEMPQITDMLMTSFTTVVGVVIASYFGASAYIEGRKPDRGKDERPAGTVSSEPSSGS